MKCEYCEKVSFETDDPRDRRKLLDKKSLAQSFYINGNEFLNVEYYYGYFLIKDRCKINYCPMCGQELEREAE